MSDKDDIELLMAKVEMMRTHQRDYFARRSETDKQLAIRKEKEVDEMMRRLRGRGYNPDRFKITHDQNKMF
jgi:hypothetical protein